jgi:hypothetical protein
MNEWTLEHARKQWKPMTKAVQHVGVPGYQFQAGVLWDGSLVFGPLEFLKLRVMQQELAPLGDSHQLHISVGYGQPVRFVDRKGTGNPLIVRSLEGGRLPIPHVETSDDSLAWHETVFAHLEPKAPYGLDRGLAQGIEPAGDDLLVVHARFQVRNTAFARRTGHLWLHFGTPAQVRLGYKVQVTPDEVAPAIPHRYEAPFGTVDDKVRYVLPQPAKGTLRWHDQVPAPAGIKNALEKVIEWEVPLAAGEDAELRLVIPFGLVTADQGRRLAALDSDALYQEVRAFWRSQLYGPGQIVTPDPFVNDYLVAVAGQMAQQVAYRSHSTQVWMYKTSPNHYEGYWPCNAAKALPAFDLRGFTQLNRRVLQSFIDCQTSDVLGLEKSKMGHGELLEGEGYARIHGFMGGFGEWTANPLVLSHGLAMWALASHFRITRDRQWLGEGPGSPLEAMLSAFDWVSTQRRRTMREVDGKQVPYWGLLPAASAHDWLAGNTIFNDAFCIYGMIEVARLLREIGHPRAEELVQEVNDYRGCLHARYAAARDQARPLPLPDGTSIPYVPRIVQELDWAQPDWTYTCCGPLRAGAWGALDPDDSLVDESLAFLEAGLPKGEGNRIGKNWKERPDNADLNFADVADPDAERHYFWRHYVEYETMWPMGGPLFLARDDLPRFFEFLAHNLAVVLHHDFRVGVESLDGVPSCAPGDGERWQIIRRMFINERGGYDCSQQELFLLQAIPREWLRPGYRLSVRDMGTWFGGKIDLAVEVAADGDSVAVEARLAGLAVAPKEIRMRLRSGDGRPLAAAEINGVPTQVLSGDTILLPLATSGAYRIRGMF